MTGWRYPGLLQNLRSGHGRFIHGRFIHRCIIHRCIKLSFLFLHIGQWNTDSKPHPRLFCNGGGGQTLMKGQVQVKTVIIKQMGVNGGMQPSIFTRLVIGHSTPWGGIPLSTGKCSVNKGIGGSGFAISHTEFQMIVMLSRHGILTTKVIGGSCKIHHTQGISRLAI